MIAPSIQEASKVQLFFGLYLRTCGFWVAGKCPRRIYEDVSSMSGPESRYIHGCEGG